MAELVSLVAVGLAVLALWWTSGPDKPVEAPDKKPKMDVNMEIGALINSKKGLRPI